MIRKRIMMIKPLHFNLLNPSSFICSPSSSNHIPFPSQNYSLVSSSFSRAFTSTFNIFDDILTSSFPGSLVKAIDIAHCGRFYSHSNFHLRSKSLSSRFSIEELLRNKVNFRTNLLIQRSSFSTSPSSSKKDPVLSGATVKGKKEKSKKSKRDSTKLKASPSSSSSESTPSPSEATHSLDHKKNQTKGKGKGKKKTKNMVACESPSLNSCTDFTHVNVINSQTIHPISVETASLQLNEERVDSIEAVESIFESTVTKQNVEILSPSVAYQTENVNAYFNGGIHLILGPMFAGKTTALIKRMKEVNREGKNVVIVKSCLDNRYAKSEIVSHDGEKLPCIPISSLYDFRRSIGEDAYNQIDVIGIDEAQFIHDLGPFCIHAADNDKKIIIAAGLDGDFLRRKFGGLVDLVPVCETVTKLSSRCELCGSRAVFTLRKSPDLQTTIVGGSDLYMPVCREHYVQGQIAIRTASLIVNEHNSSLEQKQVQFHSVVINKDKVV